MRKGEEVEGGEGDGRGTIKMLKLEEMSENATVYSKQSADSTAMTHCLRTNVMLDLISK